MKPIQDGGPPPLDLMTGKISLDEYHESQKKKGVNVDGEFHQNVEPNSNETTMMTGNYSTQTTEKIGSDQEGAKEFKYNLVNGTKPSIKIATGTDENGNKVKGYKISAGVRQSLAKSELLKEQKDSIFIPFDKNGNSPNIKLDLDLTKDNGVQLTNEQIDDAFAKHGATKTLDLEALVPGEVTKIDSKTDPDSIKDLQQVDEFFPEPRPWGEEA